MRCRSAYNPPGVYPVLTKAASPNCDTEPEDASIEAQWIAAGKSPQLLGFTSCRLCIFRSAQFVSYNCGGSPFGLRSRAYSLVIAELPSDEHWTVTNEESGLHELDSLLTR